MKKLIAIIALACILVAPLSACNTVSGMGKDMRAAGDAMTNSAEGTKGY